MIVWRRIVLALPLVLAVTPTMSAGAGGCDAATNPQQLLSQTVSCATQGVTRGD